MKLKVSCFNLPIKKHEGFGFDDPGPPLKYGSLAASEFHYTLINTHSLTLELDKKMQLTNWYNHH
jgi:hypothetical protein